MKIFISNITLQNFKCFRDKAIKFESPITTIRGRNGVGKTTIADAILFCLFGKNTQGQSDLDLFKTRHDGVIIPNLDHSVEILFNIDSSKQVTLKRSIKEVWVKKRGSDESVFKNNTVEYFVNGESYTAADYKKYISSLIDEETFRIITNPSYFPSKKWQEQREYLTRMAGDITEDEIAVTDELKQLVKLLDGEPIESYRKHLSYQLKQVKDKLSKIPVRLEELNKALPNQLNWDELSKEQSEKNNLLDDIVKKIILLKTGGGADIKREQLRKQLSDVQNKISILVDNANDSHEKARLAQQKDINLATAKFNDALNNQRMLEQTINADQILIKRCQDTIDDCNNIRQDLISQWPKDKFTIDNSLSVCPTCGQPLPQEMFDEKIKVLREQFNLSIEKRKQDINDKGKKNNETKQKAEEELAAYQEKLLNDQKQLETIKESINDIFSQKARFEKAHVETTEEILSATEYASLVQQEKDIKLQIDNATESEEDNKQLKQLEEQRVQLVSDISSLNQQITSKSQYDKIVSLIDDVKSEQKELVKQQSDLERQEDIASEYQFRQTELLEERVNKHFSIVRWKMFRTINNGGDPHDEPFCECYVNGVAYHEGLNQAARLNAGLDICEALCRFYKVSAPIVIDNAESNLNIYQTTGQQVRLEVFDSDLQLI